MYFDNAATTFPKPECVKNAVIKAIDSYGANPGRGAHRYSIQTAEMVYNTREKLSNFFGGSPNYFFFTLNCTDSLNTAINGTIKANDHVITTVYEHNSVLRPLNALKNKLNIDITVIGSNGTVTAAELESAIMARTRMFIVNIQSNVTGTVTDIVPLYKICKKHGIVMCVDAAQAAGTIDIATDSADMICMPAHKSLYGISGCGVLYIRQGLEITPLRTGGTGTDSIQPNQPEYRPEKYESGTLPAIAIAALNAGLDFVIKNGKAISQAELQCATMLTNELASIKGIRIYSPLNRISNIVCFNIKDTESGIIADRLNREYDIAVRAGLHCAPLVHKMLGTQQQGAVRVSFGAFNTKEQTEKLIKAIKALAK